ncbi:MAG: hypothetical protein CML03_06625, partial [Pseudooceanicola sp.]|nr:hypothetical protein [Pseudooceanicola sp.]
MENRMSRWSDQFDNHAIHATVQQLRDWLDVEVVEIDAEHEDERRRFTKGLASIVTGLEGLDSEFFPENQLTNLNKQLRQPQVWNEVQSYSSNQNVQHLRTANDHLTGQVAIIHQISALAGPPQGNRVWHHASYSPLRTLHKNASSQPARLSLML